MKVKGTILKIYSKKINWASILLKKDSGGTVHASGKIISPIEGNRIGLEGRMETHPIYGPQLKVTASSMEEDRSEDGMIRYLSSGFIKGIGEKLAGVIVGQFGENTLDVIEQAPERLAEVPGIGKKRAMEIAASYQENRCYFELGHFFDGKATEYQVRTIYDKYGDKSLKLLKEDIYRLIHDIDGFGFKKVDQLALKSGIKPDDPQRTAAAITYSIEKMSVDGHCYCGLDSLESHVKDDVPDISTQNIGEAIIHEIDEGHLIFENGKIYTASLYQAETSCAQCVASMALSPTVKSVSRTFLDARIARIENTLGFRLEKKQKESVAMALTNRLSIITGGPGCGKTTVIQAILDAWQDDDSVFLLAPTGKAAQRITYMTGGRLKAMTVHHLLSLYRKDRERFRRLSGLIILDEASMLDLNLAAAVLRFALWNNSNMVLIGDIYQLPPIGPGLFFRDLVWSPCVPSITLETSHRQTGKIALNAEKINAGYGVHAFVQDDSFRFIPAERDVVQDVVVQNYLKLLEQYPVTDICCLVPMREEGRSRTASDTLNKMIREKVNPYRNDDPVISGCPYRVGDRVMQTINDYKKDVFNGDCGIIIQIDPSQSLLHIKMDDERVIPFEPYEMQNFVFAYAMSIHKSQGSEYKAVIVVQSWEHYRMLQRNLLYTAVTRAREKVLLIGEAKAVNMAIKKIDTSSRNTQLRERIGREVSARRN